MPWLAGAIAAGGVIAQVSLMFGLRMISGFSASLFLNLEGVATAIIAVLFFRENAGKRVWLALICMTLAGVFLTWNEQSQFSITRPLLVALACVGWGIDNNLITYTHSHHHNDPQHQHGHRLPIDELHAHEHIHKALSHTHSHWPDTEHRHPH